MDLGPKHVLNPARISAACHTFPAVKLSRFYLSWRHTGGRNVKTVSLHQHLLTRVNGKKVSFPYISRTLVITMERHIVKVRTRNGLFLDWDGDSFLEVRDLLPQGGDSESVQFRKGKRQWNDLLSQSQSVQAVSRVCVCVEGSNIKTII